MDKKTLTDEELIAFLNDKMALAYFGYLEVCNREVVSGIKITETISLRELIEGIYYRTIEGNYLGHFDPTGPTGAIGPTGGGGGFGNGFGDLCSDFYCPDNRHGTCNGPATCPIKGVSPW